MGTTSTAQDLAALSSAHINLIICLQQAHELRLLDPPESLTQRRAALHKLGIRFAHYPIEDFDAPPPALLDALLTDIHTSLNAQARVVIHCMAGLGRAGTVAACYLVHAGMSAHDALCAIRWVRPGAVQSLAQERCIFDLAQRLRAPQPDSN
jgi:protein-tyrosine phosphatase